MISFENIIKQVYGWGDETKNKPLIKQILILKFK